METTDIPRWLRWAREIEAIGQTGDETLAVDFFGLDQLPPLSPSRVSERIIVEAFAHSHDPQRLAAFD